MTLFVFYLTMRCTLKFVPINKYVCLSVCPSMYLPVLSLLSTCTVFQHPIGRCRPSWQSPSADRFLLLQWNQLCKKSRASFLSQDSCSQDTNRQKLANKVLHYNRTTNKPTLRSDLSVLDSRLHMCACIGINGTVGDHQEQAPGDRQFVSLVCTPPVVLSRCEYQLTKYKKYHQDEKEPSWYYSGNLLAKTQ